MARAGALNKRVIFQLATEVADGGGGNALTWADALTVWGQFLPERGRERLEAGRLEASVAGLLRVRSSAASRAVTERYRVQIDSVPYQIRSISNPDQRNVMLEMLVERGGAAGVAT